MTTMMKTVKSEILSLTMDPNKMLMRKVSSVLWKEGLHRLDDVLWYTMRHTIPSFLLGSRRFLLYIIQAVETVGIDVGELRNPRKTLPSATRKVSYRILVFCVLCMFFWFSKVRSLELLDVKFEGNIWDVELYITNKPKWHKVPLSTRVHSNTKILHSLYLPNHWHVLGIPQTVFPYLHFHGLFVDYAGVYLDTKRKVMSSSEYWNILNCRAESMDKSGSIMNSDSMW